jgi:hypothetical protein
MMIYLRIAVVGLGGGWLTPRLLAFFMSYFMPSSTLVLVDGSIYKPNHRDHEDFPSLGNKARISGDFIRREYPGLRFEIIPKYVGSLNGTGVIALNDVIFKGDLVFLQVDSAKTKRLVEDHVSGLDDITLISGGTNEDQLRIQVYIRRRGREITPKFSTYCEDIANPTDESPVDKYLHADELCEGCRENIGKTERHHPFTMMTTSTLMMNAFYAIWKLESLGQLSDFPWYELWYDIVTGKCRTEKIPSERRS